MKRNFLFSVFTMLLCLIGGGSAWATVTVSPPISNKNISADTDNKFNVVFYNVGAGAFLTHGNDWGTRASVGAFQNTNDFTVAIANKNLNNSWIHLNNYANEQDLFVSGSNVEAIYCDNKDDNRWVITLSSDGTYYTIQNKNQEKYPGRYLGLKAGTTIVDLVSTEVNDNTKWYLMPASNIDANLLPAQSRLYALIVEADSYGADVTESEAVYTTATIAADLDAESARLNKVIAGAKALKDGVIPTNNTTNWVVSSLGAKEEFVVNTWSHEGESDGSNMTTPFLQNWIEAGEDVKLSDKTITYEMEGLTAGWYEIGGRFRCLNELGGVIPQGIYMTMNDDEYSMTDDATAITNGSYKVLTKAVQVGSDGKLTVGVKVDGTNVNWINWKDFTIKAVSEPTVDEINAEWAKISGEKCEATLYSAASDAKTKVQKSKSPSDFAAFKEAVATVQLSAEAYARVKAALDKGDIIKATFDKAGKDAYEADIDGIPTQYNNGTLLTETCDANAAFILYTAIPKGALAQTTPGSDMTAGIVNNSFETGDLTGWTATMRGDTKVAPNSNATYTTEGCDGSYLFNTWDWSATPFDVKQKIYVHSGIYRLSALYASAADGEGNPFKAKLNAGSYSIEASASEGQGKFVEVTLDEIKVEADGELEISMTSDNWFKADNFRLTYLGEAAYTMNIPNKWATFVAPFEVEIPAGVTAKAVDAYANGKFTYTEYTGTIPAETPVLVKSDEAVSETFYGKAATDDEATAGVLVGALKEGVTIAYGSAKKAYVLQDKGEGMNFYYVNVADVKLPVGKAYLMLDNAGDNAPAVISLEDETTAITSVQQRAETVKGEAYDLTGRRVSVQGKGLYIVNGKKIVK